MLIIGAIGVLILSILILVAGLKVQAINNKKYTEDGYIAAEARVLKWEYKDSQFSVMSSEDDVERGIWIPTVTYRTADGVDVIGVPKLHYGEIEKSKVEKAGVLKVRYNQYDTSDIIGDSKVIQYTPLILSAVFSAILFILAGMLLVVKFILLV